MIGLLVAGLLHVMFPVWRGHSGMVWGDSYTYACFGRVLARGHFYFDGPVGDAFSLVAEQGRDVRSPVWNSNILSNGKTVYSIAMGYPLFLSLMIRLGGTWLLMHSNLLLLLVMLLLAGLVIWEGLGRTGYAFAVAAGAMLIVPRLSPATFSQFSYLWREPLFFSCILLGCYAFLRFAKSNKGRWLCLMAFVMGYACAIKEANIIYVPWMGLLVLCSRSFWQRKDKIRIILLCALCFLVGIAPLLIQNMIATGNPILSSQTLRATDKEVTSKGMGLSAGNASTTLQNYLEIYSNKTWFAWPWLLAAAAGLVASLRYPLGRLLAGLALAHILLYCQWGNAEQRHMYWINFPYAFFISYGIFYVSRWGCRFIPKHHHVLSYAGVFLVALLVIWPVPWKVDEQADRERIQYSDAHRLAVELENQVAPGSLILANRVLRDILGAYSDLFVIRMHGLTPLREDGDICAVLEDMMQDGVPLYFLDNTDKDPHHNGVTDWALVDYELLRSRFDLLPQQYFDRNEYRLSRLIDTPQMILYAVAPWSVTEWEQACCVPDGGAAFLFVHQKTAAGDLAITMNDVPLALPKDGFYYIPVYDLALTNEVCISGKSITGMPIPQMEDLHFIGWHEKILMEYGTDAVPSDLPYFPYGFIEQDTVNCRRFDGDTFIKLPVRQRDDLFTVVGLGIKGDIGHIEVFNEGINTPLHTVPILKNKSAWFPLFLPDVPPHPWAGDVNIRLNYVEGELFRIGSILTYTAYRTVTYIPSDSVCGFVVEGKLALDDPEKTNEVWTLQLNGTSIDLGHCGPNPFMEPYRYIQGVQDAQEAYCFAWNGVGLIEPEILTVEGDFSLRLDQPSRGFISGGAYGGERDEKGKMFVWTRREFSVMVPFLKGAHSYNLKFSAVDGHPEITRDVDISFDGQTQTITLTPDLQLHELTFSANRENRGLAPLTFTIETWSPQKVLNVSDPRELGFRFYGLDWAPM